MAILHSPLLSLIVLTQGFLAKELPPFFHICHRSEPNLEDCIKNSVEEIRPLLVTGSPEYDIPSVEPLVIKELIKEESSGLSITTTDVVTYGGSNFIVNSVSTDVESLKSTIDVSLPELKVEARYKIQGKLVILQVKGSGVFHANITNCTARVVIEGEIYIKNNTEYLRYKSNTMKIEIGETKVKIEDIFKQDLLNDIINDTINKNLHLFTKELMPIIEKNLAKVFLDVGNQIVKDYTYDQLFPI